MSAAFAERISQAREFAGKSKTELAEHLGVSVAAVTQWENGSKHPTPENLVEISRALDVPHPYFLRPMPPDVLLRGPVSFRATSKAKTSARRRQAQRLAEMVAEAFAWIEQWVTFPSASIPECGAHSTPEESARECRRFWNLGDRPILKLGELLESKGIRLCAAKFHDVRVDAFSCIIGGAPIIFMGSEKQDRARSRFDAAHELGHLVMHQHYSEGEIEERGEEIEKEANSFASAFLMPAETFSVDVRDTSLGAFQNLKPKWGMSIQSMVYRAKELGLISEDIYKSHQISMGSRGWRRPQGEPFDDQVPTVNRSLGKRSLELLSRGNMIHPWEIPASLPIPASVLNGVFDTDLSKLVPTELSSILTLRVLADPNTNP